MHGVGFRFRAQLRGRWRAWVGLALLIGVAAGVVMGLAVGARRTESAYPRFLEAQDAADLLLTNEDNPEDPTARFDLDEVAAMPEVGESMHTGSGFVAIGPGVISRIPIGGTDADAPLNRPVVIEGRLPDPDVPEEIAITTTIAQRAGLEIGDTVDLLEPALISGGIPEDLFDLPEADQATVAQVTALDPANTLRVVGVVEAPGTFPPQGTSPCCAFHSRALGEAALYGEALYIQLAPGATAADLRGRLEAQSGGLPLSLDDLREADRGVQRAIHVQTVGLWVLAGLGGVVFVLVLGQLLFRQAAVESREDPELAALGMDSRQRLGLTALRALVVGVVAAVVGVATAWTVSGFFPTGLADLAETDPGPSVDLTVWAAGVAAAVLLILVFSVLGAALVSRRRVRTPSRRAPRVLTGLIRSRRPVPLSAGARMAVTRGRGDDAVPVLSSFGAIALGVAVLVAALVFSASLQHLLATPSLYGLGWDVQVTSYAVPIGDIVGPMLEDDPDTAAFATGSSNLQARVGDEAVVVTGIDPVQGDVLPPMIDGRVPRGDDEVALGATTMDALDVDIGDTVDMSAVEGITETLTVVGVTVLPDSSSGARLGAGALTTATAVSQLAGLGDEAAHQDLFVLLEPGVDEDVWLEDLTAEVCGSLPPDEADGCVLYGIPFSAPTDIVNFGRAEQLPEIMGGVLAVLAAGTLVHVVVSATRRRRHDLALFRVVGFTRGQVALAVMASATTAALAALVIGVPVGIAAGRWLWTARADQLGIVAVVTIPVLLLVAVGAGALVLANVIGLIPGWAAARQHPSKVLRTE